ncbi:MotA/TolQ/ExbB proton channel family protein [Neiella marina]|uniref:MotA/TolQ/ExbB proton channel family protein n=1 Tax=Neiella holothuriorum TaxID=2870530 RepID=A0ABS7EI65_9GAMM|nr:MotA/TolQ/ExbB proton channel family protein [Neiella holothuriorum]MBW8191588.1 MotA/TolQ/ExbB proton channel family protein [Neiella holothuriorum]
MSSYAVIQSQLGPLTLPLVLCALLATMIIVERLIVLTIRTSQRTLSHDGVRLLQSHGNQSKILREEIAAVWLTTQQQKLASGIRILQIITLVAPLLGLLGTVIGLIAVFDTIGEHTGPIEPAMLAEGLGMAMKTTAAGLIIAVPAMLGAHGFQLWVDKLVSRAEHAINISSLKIDGVVNEALA